MLVNLKYVLDLAEKGGFCIPAFNVYNMESAMGVIKAAEELYSSLEPIRYTAMANHEKLADGVFKTTYENGRFTVVNYNTSDFVSNDFTVKAEDFIII